MRKICIPLLVALIFSYACFAQSVTSKTGDVQQTGMRNDSVHVSDSLKLVNPLIVSERIDGPANIRDAIGGKLLFSLDDNVPVETEAETNKWYRLGLYADVTREEDQSGVIKKGATLYKKGKVIGKALVDLIHENGLLEGYTSIQNIRAETLPENVLSNFIEDNVIDLPQLKDFIKGYRLQQGESLGYTDYSMNGGPSYGPSSPIRLNLLFDNNHLFGVVSLRMLNCKACTLYQLNRGYYLTLPGNPPEEKVKNFIKKFNEMINHAG